MLSQSKEPRRKPLAARAADGFEVWNRRLHFYIGLFLLFFLWLFVFTGLLLNHPKWTFAEFWPARKQSTFERPIARPPVGSDLSRAQNVMAQLGIPGEIEWTAAQDDSGQLNFRVSRPGHIFEIKADLIQQRARVQRIDVNGWGVMHILHTFTGGARGRFTKPARLDSDERLGFLDGRRGGRLAADGAWQLLHVVASAEEANRRANCPDLRLDGVRRVRRWAPATLLVLRPHDFVRFGAEPRP